MELRIKNKLISEPIMSIMQTIKREITNGKLQSIIDKGSNVLVTCPCHKEGRERHPSCQVLATAATELVYGYAHCFTCGYSAPLPQFVNDCFDQSGDFGEEWLCDRFGDVFVTKREFLSSIELEKPKKQFLDPSILTKYDYYHPYMWQRKLSKEIVDKFRIGYDKEKDAITFPVWDISNNLVMITERSVKTKQFYIEADKDKPVYLLNFIRNENIKHVYVAESQINALYLWTLGYPAIALFGTGSKKQYEILNKSGVRYYTLCFDGDHAGRKGTKRFIDNISKDCVVSIVELPEGYDVNDLTSEQIALLSVIDQSDWKIKYRNYNFS